MKGILRAHTASLVLVVALVPGCGVAGLVPFFEATRNASDASTNLELATKRFPRPVGPMGNSLVLSPETQAWIARPVPSVGARFLVPVGSKPASLVAAAAVAATRAARGGAAFIIVNTDVDDTVFASLWDRGRYERGQLYPGVLELLAAQGDFVVILTARPPLFAESTRHKFLQVFGLTGVDPARVNLSIAPGELNDILDTLEMGIVKAEALLVQRRLFPAAVSVFNGDSGQGDWIAALILRDLEPAGFSYATIHDVRPWSEQHRNRLRAALVSSPRFERIYRHALGLPAGNLAPADEDRLDRALRKIRGDIDLALAGPMGRLDGEFLKTRGIFLFRNHADLALDLADAGRISQQSANRIVIAAVPALRFLDENRFGYDRGDASRLARRLAARLPGLVDGGPKAIAGDAIPAR